MFKILKYVAIAILGIQRRGVSLKRNVYLHSTGHVLSEKEIQSIAHNQGGRFLPQTANPTYARVMNPIVMDKSI